MQSVRYSSQLNEGRIEARVRTSRLYPLPAKECLMFSIAFPLWNLQAVIRLWLKVALLQSANVAMVFSSINTHRKVSSIPTWSSASGWNWRNFAMNSTSQPRESLSNSISAISQFVTNRIWDLSSSLWQERRCFTRRAQRSGGTRLGSERALSLLLADVFSVAGASPVIVGAATSGRCTIFKLSAHSRSPIHPPIHL